MINFIESFEWGGKTLCFVLIFLLYVLFFVIYAKKRTKSEDIVHYIPETEPVITVIPEKYIVEKKRIYAIARKTCDGISKAVFAIGLAGATKLVWDYSEFSTSSTQGIIILVLELVALIFSALAEGLEEKTK